MSDNPFSPDGHFSLDWLRLRAGVDLAARYPALTRRFAAALAQRDCPLRLVDLGAGTGANARALMPRLAVDQDWLLVDRDRDLVAAQAEAFTLWARRQGYPIRSGGGRIIIEAGQARWQITGVSLDLASEWAPVEEFAPDAVTASAFFDLVSAAWLERFVARLAARALPLLAVLTVDGRRVWQPPLAEDAVVARAFAQHQHGDKGFGGPALGGTAADALTEGLERQGFTVERMPSDWRLGLGEGPLLSALITGEAAAARAADPEAGEAIAAWETARRRHLIEARLDVTIGHRDLLALPGSVPRP